MRTITADVLKSDYKLPFPVSIICSGSSGAGKVSVGLVNSFSIYFFRLLSSKISFVTIN